jgi:hypothetical protein
MATVLSSTPGLPARLASKADALRQYQLVGTVAALILLVAILAEYYWIAQAPGARDFVSFWGAARLALDGTPQLAYNLDALHALQSHYVSFRAGKMPFPYTPAFLLLVLPFGLLGFVPAMVAWSFSTFAAFFAVVRRMFPGSGLLAAAMPAVFANAAVGQNGFVTGAIFIGGLLLLPKRPFVAGLLLGCLILKPQLALLLPVAVLAARAWPAVAGAAISAIGVLVLGLAVFGWQASEAWVAQMPLYVEIGRDGLVGWRKLASVYAAMRQIGLGQTAAFAIHLTVAAAAALAVWKVWRSKADYGAKAAILAAGTMLISPYIFLYDTVFLVVPFLWLASVGASPRLLVPLWFLPLVSIAQITTIPGPINIAPLVPIALMAMVWRQVYPRANSGLERAAASV